jgi:hypothetical protein
VLREVVRQIELAFPATYVEIETVPESGEAFVQVDSMTLYDSGAYQTLVAKLKGEVLWPNGVFSVFFGVADSGRCFSRIAVAPHVSHSYTEFSVYSEIEGRNSVASSRVDLSMAA